MNTVKTIAKAIAAAVAAAAAYLVGTIPAAGGFGDLSTVQWLGLLLFVLGAFGVTYAVPNRPAAVDYDPGPEPVEDNR